MDSDQNQYAFESTSLSNGDFSLLFGSSAEAERYRGAASAPESHEAPALQTRKPTTTKIFEQNEDCSFPLVNTVPEIDIFFLTRFVLFGAQITIQVVFQFVLDFIQDSQLTSGNFEADRTAYVIRGGLFVENRYVEYRFRLFTYGGKLGLSLDILDGFAPAVQEFWKQLQRALQEQDFLAEHVESDSEEDLGYLDSDDEEMDLDLLDTKFLKVGESPELVEQWFEDLSNPSFMQQTLLLLAWNCQDAQNFQVVTDGKQAQKLFDTLIACMIATAADCCLPIVRCASVLVSQLVESHDINISDEQFNVLVQTLVQWTISQNENENRLTSSQEVASLLSSQMSKLATLAVNWKDTLEQVYTQAPYDCVRENLHKVIRAY